jgi:hypothetical protein
MVTDKEEKKARSICAYSNFCLNCEECSHREFPSMEYSGLPKFDYLECKMWTEYVDTKLDNVYSFYRMLRCLVGLHNWNQYDKIVDMKYCIFRKCLRCKNEEKYVSDENKSKWVKV